MSLAKLSLVKSLGAAWRGLRLPGFYVLLLLSLAGWTLAFQYKTVYTVDLGAALDNAYVTGFNDKERNDTLNYRWSAGSSTVSFPGIGNQPVVLDVTAVGYRPAGPPPVVQLEARGQKFELQAHPDKHTDSYLVERGNALDGDITVVITSPTFSPSGDPRRLGVIVDNVTITPAGPGLRPLVVPSLGMLVGLLSGLVGIYLAALTTTRRRSLAVGCVAALGLSYAVLIIVARPELALHAAQLPSLWSWGLALALLSRLILDVLMPTGTVARSFVAGIGSAASVIAFLLRFGGTTYPQFLSSDLLLHVHNIQSVLNGQWLFTEPLPDGTPVPYPNAVYVLLSPIGLLMGQSDEALGLLLKWSGALFDAGTCLALAWGVSRLLPGRLGGLAALCYAVSPAPFVLLSAGNYSNIFAQAALNVTMLGGMVFLERIGLRSGNLSRQAYFGLWRASNLRVALALLSAGFVLTMLGHYGMMLATLGIMGVFSVWSLWETVRRGRAPEAWLFVGTWAAALLVSCGVYYLNFIAEISRQWSGVLKRLLGRDTFGSASNEVAPGLNFADFAGRRLIWIGPMTALTALFGATQLRGMARLSRALLLSWLGAALVFAVLDQALGDTVRWYYLAAAPVSFLAGRYLSLIAARRRAASILAALSLLAMLFHTLAFWVGDLIFVRYH